MITMKSIFKNKDTETGSFTFANTKYDFAGVFSTEDKELAQYLDSANNWINLTPSEPKAKEVTEPEAEKVTEKKAKKTK